MKEKEPTLEESIAQVVKSTEGIDATTEEGRLYHNMADLAIAGALVLAQTPETMDYMVLARLFELGVKFDKLRTGSKENVSVLLGAIESLYTRIDPIKEKMEGIADYRKLRHLLDEEHRIAVKFLDGLQSLYDPKSN